MTTRIEDYAIIGDTQSAALVGRDGSIDWLCLPRFDSDACFAALLGDERHGRWQIAPRAPVRAVRRRYRPGTLVLETELDTDEGRVRLIDCMPPRDRHPDVLRVVEGVDGAVAMRMDFTPRLGYGRTTPWIGLRDGAVFAIAGPDALVLRCDGRHPLELQDGGAHADFVVSAGERARFLAAWHPSFEAAPAPIDVETAVSDAEAWWLEWSSRGTYAGRYRDDVLSSCLVLKALTYAPTGGIVAAATTSLPERLGGVRNWDYRFAWLRDATMTLFALMGAGYHAEAVAWRDWLLRAVAGHPGELQIMYGVAGERRLTEITLPWLPGYEGSTPVRIGNAAVEQFQLDVYGEVLDCLHQARRMEAGGAAHEPPEDDAWRLERAIVDYVERVWRDPDEGIWEVRGPRRHFTHSKIMAWVAVDRAVKSMERFRLSGPVEHFRRLRDEIHADVCAHGFHAGRNAFTQSYGATDLDASLLAIPLVGFLSCEDPRVRGTVAAIERELVEHGLVRRYSTREEVDGLPPGEGVFLACSFWLADNMALSGRTAEARALFERLLALRNDVGLLSEQYDPVTRRQLGNFPQALSHVALINTAINLARVDGPAKTRGGG